MEQIPNPVRCLHLLMREPEHIRLGETGVSDVTPEFVPLSPFRLSKKD